MEAYVIDRWSFMHYFEEQMCDAPIYKKKKKKKKKNI